MIRDTQGLGSSRQAEVVLQVCVDQSSTVPRVSFVPGTCEFLSCLCRGSSYLEPVGNVGVETTDLSNAVIENIDGLARLKSGLQLNLLALAQTLLACCCSSTCCGSYVSAERGETYHHGWILLPIHCD
jgi:hypothetical protein